MGRAKSLTPSEKNIIQRMKNRGFCISDISKNTGRSRKVILNFLKSPESYGTKKSPGRPPALTTREKRAILRVASNSTLTARQIAARAGVVTNLKNVQRVIRAAPHIKRKKMKGIPPLSSAHKERRKAFAREHVQWKDEWKTVLFTDEKKFNLDGPDGWAHYYHDLRKEEKVFSKRQMGGGSVMIWGGIGYDHKTDLVFISGRMNSQQYVNLLENQLKKYFELVPKDNVIFQQDNAPVHTAKVAKEFFRKENIRTIDWPARSPDFNIIENVWGHLARSVYSGSRQFESVEELKQTIQEEWANLPQELIRRHFHSLSNRMIAALEKGGAFTGY